MNDLFFYLSIAIVLDHMLSTEDRENNESESMPLRLADGISMQITIV